MEAYISPGGTGYQQFDVGAEESLPRVGAPGYQQFDVGVQDAWMPPLGIARGTNLPSGISMAAPYPAGLLPPAGVGSGMYMARGTNYPGSPSMDAIYRARVAPLNLRD